MISCDRNRSAVCGGGDFSSNGMAVSALLLLGGVGHGCIHGDESNGDGAQDKLQRGVRVGNDVDGIFGEVAILGDNDLVDVAFFTREDDGPAGVCLERLGGLNFVCQFHLGSFNGFSRNGVCYDDRVTDRDAFFGIVILKAGGKKKG